MFRHTDYLQFDAKPEKPDPVYAHKLQELIGGAYGEMIATMIARLLEGAPAAATTKAAAADPVVGAVLGGMDPQQAIVAGGDGLETSVAPNALFDGEYAEHTTSVWHLSDSTAGHEGGWAAGPQPDGTHEFGYLLDPEPMGGLGSAPAPDPKLYATYDGKQGEPSGPALACRKE